MNAPFLHQRALNAKELIENYPIALARAKPKLTLNQILVNVNNKFYIIK